MFAAQTPESPVQVLDRQRTSRIDHKLSDRVNGEGRKSLVAAGRHRARWPTQGLKHINDTANIVEGGRHDTNITMLSALQAPSGSRTTYTVAVQATPPARSKPDGGVKVDIESLPGQNQGKPTLDDARLDVPVLPGVNQDTSGMYEAPKQVSPAEASKPSHFPGAPAITVNKPLPGQNQEDPIKGGVIPPSAPTFPAPATSVLSSIPSRTGSPVASQPSSTIPSALSSPPPSEASSGLINLSNLALSLQTSTSLVFGSSSTSSLTSFVTLTRSEQGKLEAPVPIAPPRTVSTMAITISSTGADATARTSTHAVAAAQSVSGLIASTTASIIATSSPTTSSDNQGASILHPTARTLLILFVILGVMSILVAILVSMMIKSHRRRSGPSQQNLKHQVPYDAADARSGVTTHISANPNDNPFLTASEKAIIDRAASPNGDLNDSSRFTDAISSFIKKSRRLTYKISP